MYVCMYVYIYIYIYIYMYIYKAPGAGGSSTLHARIGRASVPARACARQTRKWRQTPPASPSVSSWGNNINRTLAVPSNP